MAKTTTWTCDGCGLSLEGEERPANLHEVCIEVFVDGALLGRRRDAEVCESCKDRLWQATDVSQWDRTKDEPEAPPAPPQPFLKATEEVRQLWAKRSDGSMKASDIDWKKVAERVLEAKGKAKGKREPWQDFNLPQTYKASSIDCNFPQTYVDSTGRTWASYESYMQTMRGQAQSQDVVNETYPNLAPQTGPTKY
jgi:hypothetical protein